MLNFLDELAINNNKKNKPGAGIELQEQSIGQLGEDKEKPRFGFFTKTLLGLLIMLALALGAMYLFGFQQSVARFIKSEILASETVEMTTGEIARSEQEPNFEIALAQVGFFDSDKDGLSDSTEEIFGTDKFNPDTDGDSYQDGVEIFNGYDPYGLFGRLDWSVSIPKLRLQAPLVWLRDLVPEETSAQLKNGVLHLPLTAAPGQSGNLVITANSATFLKISETENYNNIFGRLDEIGPGDSITFEAFSQNGKKISYTYVVTENTEVSSSDSKIFEASEKPILTVIPSWPLQPDKKRMMLKGHLLE